MMFRDEFVFSKENMLKQVAENRRELGFTPCLFCVEGFEETISEKKTDEVVEFYYFHNLKQLQDRFGNVVYQEEPDVR